MGMRPVYQRISLTMGEMIIGCEGLARFNFLSLISPGERSLYSLFFIFFWSWVHNG